MPISKNKLNIPQQIEHMKQKGIKFTILDEAAAEKKLMESNYYFRLKSYAKNYEKFTNAKDVKKNGTYINLEFAYLYELSILDMHLRHILLKMTIAIEHFLKHHLVNDISANTAEDGYSIVTDFFSMYPKIQTSINETAATKGYSSKIASKYKSAMPVWVLVELLSFGDTTRLYNFYYTKYPKQSSVEPFLWAARMIRNAAAHNSCLLHELTDTTFANITNVAVDIVHHKSLIPKRKIVEKFRNRLLHDFTVMLILYQRIVTSNSERERQANEVQNFYERCTRKAHYYRYNNRLVENVLFTKKMVDNFLL